MKPLPILPWTKWERINVIILQCMAGEGETHSKTYMQEAKQGSVNLTKVPKKWESTWWSTFQASVICLWPCHFIRQQVTHCLKSRNRAWGWCKWAWTKCFNESMVIWEVIDSSPFPFKKWIFGLNTLSQLMGGIGVPFPRIFRINWSGATPIYYGVLMIGVLN